MKRFLGAFERALVISDRYAPFNIVSVLQIEGYLPEDILQQALGLLQIRHPFLGSRIVLSNNKPYFTEMEHIEIPLRAIERHGDEHWLEVAENELCHRIDITSGPLFRCLYLYNGKEGRSSGEIIMIFHHSIADGVSVINLFNELLQTCAQLQEKGKAEPLPVLSISPPIEDLFPKSFRGLGRFWRTLVYVFHQMTDEIRYRRLVHGKRTPPILTAGCSQILKLQTPQALLAELAQRARKEKVTLNSVLNAAMMVAVNRHLYEGQITPMRTFSFADLRPYVEPPVKAENIACCISMLRYTTMVDPEQNLWDLARILNTQIYRSLKSGDKFIASVVSEGLMKVVIKFRAFRMGSTALSYSGAVDLAKTYGSLNILGLYGFISNIDLGPEYHAMVSLFDDQLNWGIVYLDGDMDRIKARAIADEIHNVLESAI